MINRDWPPSITRKTLRSNWALSIAIPESQKLRRWRLGCGIALHGCAEIREDHRSQFFCFPTSFRLFPSLENSNTYHQTSTSNQPTQIVNINISICFHRLLTDANMNHHWYFLATKNHGYHWLVVRQSISTITKPPTFPTNPGVWWICCGTQHHPQAPVEKQWYLRHDITTALNELTTIDHPTCASNYFALFGQSERQRPWICLDGYGRLEAPAVRGAPPSTGFACFFLVSFKILVITCLNLPGALLPPWQDPSIVALPGCLCLHIDSSIEQLLGWLPDVTGKEG